MKRRMTTVELTNQIARLTRVIVYLELKEQDDRRKYEASLDSINELKMALEHSQDALKIITDVEEGMSGT